MSRSHNFTSLLEGTSGLVLDCCNYGAIAIELTQSCIKQPLRDGGSGFIVAGLILGLRPASERRRYKVTPSLIDLGANLESAL